MALRRKAKPKVDNKKLIIEAFNEMAREKSIDRDLLQGIVEETLSLMVKKKYGPYKILLLIHLLYQIWEMT